MHETLKDPEFLADAQKAKLRVDAVRGEKVERVIAGLFKLDAGPRAKLKDVLYK